MRKKYGNTYPFPKKTVPKLLVWLIAPAAGFKRKMIWLNVGYPWKVDHAKSINALGMTYRPIELSMVEFFQQMVDNKVFGAAGS